MINHMVFGEGDKTLAILIPVRDLHGKLIKEHYIEPLEALGIPREQVIALGVEKKPDGSAPVGTMIRPCLENIEKMLQHINVKTVLCCDSAYFKPLAKVTKVTTSYGYPKKTIWDGITGLICPNYRSLFYDPALQTKIDMALTATTSHMLKTRGVFDEKILVNPVYPSTGAEISKLLDEYLTEPVLTLDIETYDLKVDKAGLGTAAFAIDKHTGFAFHIGNNRTIRALLKDFLVSYTGKLIFHGASFDCKILIWELFMEHPRDIKGMLAGLHIMFRNFEDTKIISYLALNSTTSVSLSLKDLAFEYTGDYAQEDIKDIRLIPLDKLLEYNLIDSCATWYVHDKYREEVKQTQELIYQELFKPAIKVITQMELCGMPINLAQVLAAEHTMDDVYSTHYDAIMTNPVIVAFNTVLQDLEAEKANSKLKKLRKTRDDFLDLAFNPNSDKQLALLLHDHLGLPILDTTPTGQPSTSGKVLKALAKRIKNGRKWDKTLVPLVEHIIELHDVAKILNTFIPAFKNNSISKEGWEYLHGCFNLGGTKSGRLSSSDPNLTNIPSTGTQYAKPIKQCFQAPPNATKDNPQGFIMVGADFRSLEDMVSALQTKDPNKLKIYTDGYDGHCLRAYTYFGDKMPDIDPNSVESINSIAEKYEDLRQLSKSPTFLLTYMGTWKGLMKQFGFTKAVAKKIEANYHELYKVSDEWVMDRVREAGKTGFVELAFGLKLRTPILPQVVLDSDSIPYQAHKEIKTAGNALGQSYGLLNTRAANEFMERVWNSKYAEWILPICQIHDSQYFMIRNTLGCLKFVNDNLIECMEWNKLGPIQHDTIKLGANLEIYYPNWNHKIKVPNYLSLAELEAFLRK